MSNRNATFYNLTFCEKIYKLKQAVNKKKYSLHAFSYKIVINMTNLEIIQKDITDCTEYINKLLTSLNNPSNIILKKDRNWGRQTVQLYLRLDEVSTTELEKLMPRLKEALNKFHELRKKEAQLTNETDIINAINPMAPTHEDSSI